MSIKNVTSKDPRKNAIVTALRRKTGDPKAGRVTSLREDTVEGTFSGHVLKPDPKGSRGVTITIGTFTVTAAECGLDG